MAVDDDCKQGTATACLLRLCGPTTSTCGPGHRAPHVAMPQKRPLPRMHAAPPRLRSPMPQMPTRPKRPCRYGSDPESNNLSKCDRTSTRTHTHTTHHDVASCPEAEVSRLRNPLRKRRCSCNEYTGAGLQRQNIVLHERRPQCCGGWRPAHRQQQKLSAVI